LADEPELAATPGKRAGGEETSRVERKRGRTQQTAERPVAVRPGDAWGVVGRFCLSPLPRPVPNGEASGAGANVDGDLESPGNLAGNLAPGELVERQIDAFVAERHAKRVEAEGERQGEAAWKESVKAYNRRRSEAAAEMCQYHLAQASRLRSALVSLIEHHELEASKCAKG